MVADLNRRSRDAHQHPAAAQLGIVRVRRIADRR
jgi:hypothetical protein